MCPGDAVRAILNHNLASALNQLRGACSRSTDRQNAVRVAMNNQCGHVDACQVFAKVLVPRRHARERGRGRGAGRKIPARLDSFFTDALTQQKIGVVEILEKLSEERITVRGNSFLDSLENTAVHAFGVLRSL